MADNKSATRIEIETDRRGLSELSKEEMEDAHGGRCVYGTPENGCEPGTPLDPKPPRGPIVLVDQTAAID